MIRPHPPSTRPVRPARSASAGFTLLEMLVSAAILAIILTSMLSLMNATSASYRMTVGKIDVLEGARAGFEAMGRTLRQATLQSYLGYDDPRAPTAYKLKSDLHFITGSRQELGIIDDSGRYSPHAVFFQAPLGITDIPSLDSANALLVATGFFLAYGDEPHRPPPVAGKTPDHYRFRLFQFIQPRESSKLYSHTLTTATEGGGTFPVSNPSFSGNDWFDSAATGMFSHVLAENVIALVILPVVNDAPAPAYLWNSRDTGTDYSHNRLPQSLKLMMAVIDEASAKKLDGGTTPPVLVPDGLFETPANFDSDLQTLEDHLSNFEPKLNFRIFSAEIPLSNSVWNL